MVFSAANDRARSTATCMFAAALKIAATYLFIIWYIDGENIYSILAIITYQLFQQFYDKCSGNKNDGYDVKKHVDGGLGVLAAVVV